MEIVLLPYVEILAGFIQFFCIPFLCVSSDERACFVSTCMTFIYLDYASGACQVCSSVLSIGDKSLKNIHPNSGPLGLKSWSVRFVPTSLDKCSASIFWYLLHTECLAYFKIVL